MDKKFTAKVEIELTGEMVSNLALMGGYFSHQQAIENAAEDIGTILREKMIGLPVKGGKLRVGLANNESKTAWIEFQRDHSAVCADLALLIPSLITRILQSLPTPIRTLTITRIARS